MHDRTRNWPDWRCGAIESSCGHVCDRPATTRAHPISTTAAWWYYCDRHAPATAEKIPRDELFYTVRLVGELEVAGLPGDPQETVDDLVARLRSAIALAGGRLHVAHTCVQVTTPAALAVPPLRLVGTDGEGPCPEKPEPVRQPGRPEWLSRPRSRRRA